MMCRDVRHPCRTRPRVPGIPRQRGPSRRYRPWVVIVARTEQLTREDRLINSLKLTIVPKALCNWAKRYESVSFNLSGALLNPFYSKASPVNTLLNRLIINESIKITDFAVELLNEIDVVLKIK